MRDLATTVEMIVDDNDTGLYILDMNLAPIAQLEADEFAEDDLVENTGGGTIVTKRQKCGADCECNSGKGHGPYRWRVTIDGKGGRNWEYLGKA